MKKWLLYQHTSPSGKVYIGITSNTPKQRWREGAGYKDCTIFYKAIQKYGWANIYHEILLEGRTESEIKYAEKYLIRWYKIHGLSYNITDGGDGSLGLVFSQETREKMRLKKLGKPLTEAHKEKIRKNAEKLKGIPRTPEVKQKLHEANKGKKPAPQTMEALCEYNRLHPMTQERIDKMHEGARRAGYATQIAVLNRNRESIGIKHRKRIVMLSLRGDYIKEFNGAKFAELETGAARSSIAKCCKGTQSKAGGYLWMYEEDYSKYKEEGSLKEILQQMVYSSTHRAPRSIEWRKLKSLSLKGIDNRSEVTKECMTQRSIEATSKPLMQMTMAEEPIAVFYSVREASRKTQKGFNSISRCCNGKAESFQGFKWKFISKEEYEQYKLQLAA